MDPTTKINEHVRVVLDCNIPDKLARNSKHWYKKCKPLCMIWRGEKIEFKEAGLKHPTQQGRRMIHVFEMTDGANDYRLEFDAEALTWKLIEMIPGDTR